MLIILEWKYWWSFWGWVYRQSVMTEDTITQTLNPDMREITPTLWIMFSKTIANWSCLLVCLITSFRMPSGPLAFFCVGADHLSLLSIWVRELSGSLLLPILISSVSLVMLFFLRVSFDGYLIIKWFKMPCTQLLFVFIDSVSVSCACVYWAWFWLWCRFIYF